MKTEVAEIKKILNQLANVFKRDMYLINSTWAIGGEESNESLAGDYICVMNPNIAEMLHNYFGNFEVIYFSDVKKAKAALDTIDEYPLIKTNIEPKISKKLLEFKNKLMSKIDETETWDNFNFTESQVQALLDSEKITLFSDNDEVPELYVSKTVFPMIKEKNIGNLYYHVRKTKGMKDTFTMFTSFDTDNFIIYSRIHFIKMNNNETKD